MPNGRVKRYRKLLQKETTLCDLSWCVISLCVSKIRFFWFGLFMNFSPYRYSWCLSCIIAVSRVIPKNDFRKSLLTSGFKRLSDCSFHFILDRKSTREVLTPTISYFIANCISPMNTCFKSVESVFVGRLWSYKCIKTLTVIKYSVLWNLEFLYLFFSNAK